MGFTNPIVGSLGRLIRQAIQSANFVAGAAGWRISRDGAAEFSDLTARGELLTRHPNGSYVRIAADPTAGALMEQRPADSAGTVITPGRYRTGVALLGSDTALVIEGPEVDGQRSARIAMTCNAFDGDFQIESGYFYLQSTHGATWAVNGDWEIGTFTDNGDGTITIELHTQFWADGTAALTRAEVDEDLTVWADGLVAGDLDVGGDLYVGGVGQRRRYVAGSLSKTNNTLADVPGVAVTLAPGARYRVEVRVAYDAPTAVDARFAWSTTHASVTADRCILSLANVTTSNVNTPMASVRRGLTTPQLVGGPGGAANTQSVHWEDMEVTNPTGSTQTIRLQFAQDVTNATPAVCQGGYVYVERVE